MANMFSGHTNKEIPKYMSECLQPDPVTTNLWRWCERLETWGKFLFWAIALFGIISAISVAFVTEEVVSKLGYTIETETVTKFEFGLLLMTLLEFALYAFLEYCAYHALALLLGALASITQNTNITANIVLYEANKNGGTDVPAQEPTPPAKSASRAIFSDSRKDSYSQVVLSSAPAPVGMWTCGKCGTHNKTEHGQCKKCGTFRG